MTIDSLRKQGFKVFVSHRRNYEIITHMKETDFEYFSREAYPLLKKSEALELDLDGSYINAKGGLSTIAVYKDDNLVAQAETKCSKDDTFNRKRALQILLGRVQKQLIK